MKPKIILHGECTVFKSALPNNAVKQTITDEHVIVAESETVGNHHVVENRKGCSFYKIDDLLFMKNTVPTKIKCVHENRHDAITLEPAVWQFGVQKEYDYMTGLMQAVKD